MDATTTEISLPSTNDVEITFTVVSNPTREMLNEKELVDYRGSRERYVRWLLTMGKDPEHDYTGYSEETVSRGIRRLGQFDRWRWDRDNAYSTHGTPDDANEFLNALAFTDYSQSHKAKAMMELKRYFKWRHYEHAEPEWEPKRKFSNGNDHQPQDYITKNERAKIRQEALDYGTLPWYQNWTSEERERLKPYIAQRVDKPVNQLSRDDWNELTSWKETSLVWTSLDTGLRPIEVERAKLSWLNLQNNQLKIPREDSSKNENNWHVALREETAEALRRWRDERSYNPRYDDTDLIWLTQHGTPYQSKSLKRLLLTLCENAGIETQHRKISWYSIRHSVGTYMTQQKGLAATKAQLRHEDIKTTVKYDATPPEDRRDALNKMG